MGGGGGQLPHTSLRVKPIFNTKTFFGPKFGLYQADHFRPWSCLYLKTQEVDKMQYF